MNLGLVIPVWNDQTALTSLLKNIGKLGLFAQIVVVDDGSDVSVVLPQIDVPDVRLIRQARAGGPGIARNIGAAQITTSHVLFFDSDDVITSELSLLWQDLQDQAFDFCIFRHADSRQIRRGYWGLTEHDSALWRAAAMVGGRALHRPGPHAAALLAQTANYPWNKIWRTDFLRTNDISCSEMRVHEDIAPHWLGFLNAETILASDRVAAVHFVAPNANRLTNLQGPERLAVFDPLNHIMSRLAEAPANKADLLPAFLNFACQLLDWIHGNLDPRWHDDLAIGRRAFWQAAVPPARFTMLLQRDPALALHLTLQMSQEPLAC
jgi:glycosyltransferase involved in cell wall biosynthesis